MRRAVFFSVVAVLGCGPSVDDGRALGTGADDDPVVKLARQTLITDLDTCLLGTTQGPRRLIFDNYQGSSAGSSPQWPMNDGYDAEFSGDWEARDGRARVGNPIWPGAASNAPPRPFTSGIVKFMDVCPLPGTAVSVSAVADTTEANDAITDATLVLYVFDGAANLLSVHASYALRAGNRRPLSLRAVSLPINARRLAVVPMVRLGPTELKTVFYDDLALDVDGTYTTVADFSDDLSTSEVGQYGPNQPTGWGEWGGADFFTYQSAWATVWNGSWGGEARTTPPWEGGAFKTVALPTTVRAGDVISAQVLSANTFKDAASYSMLRITVGANVAESAKLFGTAWSNLEITPVRIPAGATSFTEELLVGLGATESSSLYFDDLRVKVLRPSVTARAAKTYSPGRSYDAVFELGAEANVDVPAALPIDTASYAGAATPWDLAAGNAGNQDASVVYTTASGSTVTCTYRSGASQSHPNNATQLALARQYNFRSCSNGAAAGGTVAATKVVVRVDGGDSNQPSTRVAVPLSWSLR